MPGVAPSSPNWPAKRSPMECLATAGGDLRRSAVIKTDDERAQRQCLRQTQPGFLVKRRVQHGAGGRKPRQQSIPRQPSFELHAVSDVPPARGTLETTPFRAAAAKDQSRVRAPDMSERA